MNGSRLSYLVGVLIVLGIFLSSLYTVSEGQQALVLRLGKIVNTSEGKAYIAGPGIHFKTPFIEQVLKFDTRVQTNAAQSSQIYIEEEKYFVVDYYLQWQIKNPAIFYTATGGDPTRAQTLMQQKVDSGLRQAFGTRALKDVVAQDRVNIVTQLQKQTDDAVKNLGVSVIDVRLKKIDLPDKVKQSVFNSMRAGREMLANNYRANGNRIAEQIRAQADAERIIIVATAERQASDMRAQGQAQASQIYSKAYQNDPDFYSFYQSLVQYQRVFSTNKDMMVLQPDSDFFKYFNSISGKAAAATSSVTDKGRATQTHR